MAIWSGLSGILNTGSAGAVWQPKASKIRVGRDVGAFTSTTFSGRSERNTVIGNGDDVVLKSKDMFSQVRSAVQKGFVAKQFRSINDQDLKDGAVVDGGRVRESGDYAVNFSGGELIVTKGGYRAQIQDGMLVIHKKPEDEGKPHILVMKAAIKEDARLVWNENGEPELLTGKAARTNGVLKAQSENEVILSLSGSDVEAGEGTVVWNLSGKAGTYSGGDNVTYLGNYEGGTFTDTEGKVTFGGYFNQTYFSNLNGISEFSGVFEEVSVALEKGHGTFSGYFAASDITGAAANVMSGLFLNACTVRGGDGDDTLNGRFIGGSIDGGEGDNSFGHGVNLMRELVGSRTINEKTYLQSYKGVEADFIYAAVTAGSGKDSVSGVAWGGSFALGEGGDSTDGIFSGTVINGGGGNDTLQAKFAVDSTFDTGEGDDSVTLITAVSNTITTGEGTNSITMGLNDVASSAMTWQTRDEYYNNARPRETGELAHNTIDASRGENAVTVNNGETSRRVVTGDRRSEDEGAASETERQPGEAASAAATEEELPSAAHKAMNAAINRYREMYGMEPQNKGETAATIDFGNGSAESFMSAEREDARGNQKENGMSIIQTVRRYNIDGTISWKHWQRVA